ncbi:hypothetical protein Micbo1qcDRAFT_208463 [Microdochium bolleyi]|uniref:GRF-like zinc ribbon domain-containing protein n=1 Tax=Microdochium bolleyi TaxID=196109 RepID=A0A136IQ74_9PEZI|nr:hypothetical protein Micbo1qcDRAFT_208463 [Microdochium bolleyi]
MIFTLNLYNHSHSATPRHCPRCDQPGSYHITRQSNRKGNAGRPFYRCDPCGKFIAFDDDRGLGVHNPPCACGSPARRQVAGPEKAVARHVHYVCARGGCDYYAPHRGDDGSLWQVQESLIASLAGMKII